MSLSDLRKLNLLRPEEEWAGHSPRSNVNSIGALVSAAAGIGGCVLMAIGDGDWLTWAGVALFGIALVCFTLLNTGAIRRQSEDEPAQSDD